MSPEYAQGFEASQDEIRENGPDAPACSVNVGNLERWASLAGGAGLVAFGLSRRSLTGLGVAAVGGALVYRGATGHCHVYDLLGMNTAQEESDAAVVKGGVQVRQSTVVDRPAAELFRLWRNFENLPRFMQHLESIRVDDSQHSHWAIKGPAGVQVEWDAEIINERDGEMIAWRSLSNSDVDHAGSVRFVPSEQGSEVQVQFNYLPAGGYAGAALAWLFGESAEQQVREDLQAFKSFAEQQIAPAQAPAPETPSAST